jgi:glycosyltransferase involved in cell wall biosynthesis
MGASATSVAMATFNGGRYIRQQLDSIAAQSYLPAELIITDDGSEDDTLAIIAAFAKTAPFPVNVYRNEIRLGYRANFMRAASLCQSDLIAFCDQDDYWYPTKLARSNERFSDPEIILVYHNADVVTEDGKKISTLANFAARQSVLSPLSTDPWQFALGFTEVFRRSLLQLSELWSKSLNSQNITGPLGHDQWIFFLASVFGKIAYLDDPLVAYKQHQDNAYGYFPSASIQRLARWQFRDRSNEYLRCAAAAERRAFILDIAKSKLKGVWSQRAAAGAKYYHNVSQVYANRSVLYTSSNPYHRFRAFWRIAKKGAYAGAWGIKRKSIIVDLCLGVPIGHLMRTKTPD